MPARRSYSHRQVTKKVVDGRVRPKNRRTHTVLGATERRLHVARDPARTGFRHLLTVDDVWRFVGLLDDWPELSEGLSTIRLAEGSYRFGYGGLREIAVHAFPKRMRMPVRWFDAHGKRLLEVLDVRTVRELSSRPPTRERDALEEVYCFDENTARAWQLLDVFLHELGHHHDALSHSSGFSERGERYALDWAEARARALWPRYQRAFRI